MRALETANSALAAVEGARRWSSGTLCIAKVVYAALSYIVQDSCRRLFDIAEAVWRVAVAFAI